MPLLSGALLSHQSHVFTLRVLRVPPFPFLLVLIGGNFFFGTPHGTLRKEKEKRQVKKFSGGWVGERSRIDIEFP